MYVNVEQLKRLLRQYDPLKSYYVGRHWRAEYGLTVKFYACFVHVVLHDQTYMNESRNFGLDSFYVKLLYVKIDDLTK